MDNNYWNQLYEDGNIVIVDDFHKKPANYEHIDGMICILFINKGELIAEINGENLELKHNDVLVMSPRTHITPKALSDDFSGMIIAIREEHTKTLIKVNTSMLKCLFNASDHPVLHMTTQQEQLLGNYKSILRETLMRKDKTCVKEILYHTVGALLYELFTCIRKMNSNNEIEEQNNKGTQGERIFKQFIELLVSSEVKKRKVQYYADLLCISSKHLSAVCKQVSSKGALAWINEFVVRDIKYLLVSSDWSIKEISNYLEFPNASFFGKYVRQHLGASPTKIRTNSRK